MPPVAPSLSCTLVQTNKQLPGSAGISGAWCRVAVMMREQVGVRDGDSRCPVPERTND